MKVGELMVNDWVINRGAKVRVVDLDNYMNLIETEVTDKYDTGERVKEVEPIPLTEETLEANGIKYQFGSPWWQTADPFGNPDQFEVHINKVTTVIVKYVHQIQQALRLCGLNDLANNFKIE